MPRTEMSSAELNPGFVTVQEADVPGRFRQRSAEAVVEVDAAVEEVEADEALDAGEQPAEDPEGEPVP